MNILEEADLIVNQRSEEDERQYGPFSEGMSKAAEFASLLANKRFTTEDMFIAMIALKLSRESYSPKRDNKVDLCGYIQGLHNYQNEKDGNSKDN